MFPKIADLSAILLIIYIGSVFKGLWLIIAFFYKLEIIFFSRLMTKHSRLLNTLSLHS
jgi:hypothetical protein